VNVLVEIANKIVLQQINAGFKVADQLHSSDSVKTLDYNETVHQLYKNFKKSYDSMIRVVLWNILVEFGVHEISPTE
jgi:hypothetical protein